MRRTPSPSRPARRRLTALAAVAVAVAAGLTFAPAAVAAATTTVTGVVTGADGRALRGVDVSVGVPFIAAETHGFQAVARTRSAADGSYRMSVPVGSDQVRVQFTAARAVGGTSATGYADHCVGGTEDCAFDGQLFTLRSGATITADIALARAGELRGRLVDTFGRGIGGVYVDYGTFDSEANNVTPDVHTYTDVNGNYSLLRLPPSSRDLLFYPIPGDPTVTPARDGYVLRRVSASITSGQVTTRNAVLQGRGALAGTVYDQAGYPVAGAEVTATRPSGEQVSRLTAADGTFRIPLDPGRWRYLAVGSSTASPLSPPVTVTSFHRTVVTIVLPPTG